MSEEKDLKKAQEVYNTLCGLLDELEMTYDMMEERLMIELETRGDDLPIGVRIEVDAKRQLIMLLSQIPFAVPENRRNELAVAVSAANFGMVDGSFDYNYQGGSIVFRMTSSYRESLIGKKLLFYMLMCSCTTIDEFNDKFLVVAKSDMSYDEIIEFIKRRR